jgi:hypothetical protein
MVGSNNGSTWTTLDTRTNETAWASAETRSYLCTVLGTPYRYFRLKITANNGDTTFTQIAELHFYENIVFVAPGQLFVVVLGGAGAAHQLVKPPAEVTFSPSDLSPVPVASQLKGGTTGTAYSETITAQGGTSPYTFAVTSGALPTSLSMSSSGAITGTPSATGTFRFTIIVTDSASISGSQAFSIAIAATAAGGSANYGYTA